MRSYLRLLAAACALAAATATATAETFPSKPIRLIISAAAGGLGDTHARLVAKAMSEKLGQPVVVDNMTGAGGLISFRFLKAAPADGYTLVSTANTIAIQQTASLEPGYDIEKDFVGVGILTRSPFVLVTAPKQPYNTPEELIAYARANPAKVEYGSAGIGSTTHLVAAMFAQRAAADLGHIPYRGNSASWPDLMASRIGILFEGYAPAATSLREGKLKAIAVTGAKRLETLPDVPTLAEKALPGFDFNVWFGFFAPAKTPKDVVQKLNRTINDVLADPELAARLRKEGSEVSPMTPEQISSFMKEQVKEMEKVIIEAKVPKQ